MNKNNWLSSYNYLLETYVLCTLCTNLKYVIS